MEFIIKAGLLFKMLKERTSELSYEISKNYLLSVSGASYYFVAVAF